MYTHHPTAGPAVDIFMSPLVCCLPRRYQGSLVAMVFLLFFWMLPFWLPPSPRAHLAEAAVDVEAKVLHVEPCSCCSGGGVRYLMAVP